MKFGQDYEAALAHDEYPQHWIDSAISYKKLKKCIKRVRTELLTLGLDKDTLDALWQHVSSGAPGDDDADRLLHYSVPGNGKTRERVPFTPKLTIAVDPRDGSPMDAWLSPDTRRALRRLARSADANADTDTTADAKSSDAEARDGRPSLDAGPEHAANGDGDGPVDALSDTGSADERQHLQTIEIPLTSGSEFFQILRRELVDLDQLQQAEHDRLQSAIVTLGRELRDLRASKSKRSKADVEAWRKIFELYADAEVFLSSHEADAGARDAAQAQRHLATFSRALAEQQADVGKLGKEAKMALDRFLRINTKLLRLIKFQEINKTALAKIMKKFDKKTALHARATVSESLVRSSFLAQDLARATTFTISEEILNVIPQLSDYLCPICFSISYKPIRLRCNHVFCVRCLIVLQRQNQDHCPLCREEVVLEATSDNLDQDLMKFMKANFKKEVKLKQHDNEIQAGIDRWGAQYDKAQKCLVM